jgi:hypothetical protein
MLIFKAFDLKSRRHSVRPWSETLPIQPSSNLRATQLAAAIPERLTVDVYCHRDEPVIVREINRDRLPFLIKMLIAILF